MHTSTCNCRRRQQPFTIQAARHCTRLPQDDKGAAAEQDEAADEEAAAQGEEEGEAPAADSGEGPVQVGGGMGSALGPAAAPGKLRRMPRPLCSAPAHLLPAGPHPARS